MGGDGGRGSKEWGIKGMGSRDIIRKEVGEV